MTIAEFKAENVRYHAYLCIEYIKRGDAVEAGWHAKMAASLSR
jgi:hypothetical protein